MGVWRATVAVLALGGAVALAGCGGAGEEAGATAGSGADFVPAGAPLYVYANADRDSDQWNALEALVDKFPDGDELGRELIDTLAKEGLDYDEDLEPALGPEVVLALLSFAGDGNANALGATKPDDDARFEELLRTLNEEETEPGVSRVVDGWRIVAGNQGTLDEAQQAHEGTSLADDDTFQEAMGELPAEALLKLFVDGAAASRELGADVSSLSDLAWGSVAVTAEDDGVGFEAAGRTTGDPPEVYRATLTDAVPAGVLLAASFRTTGEQLRDLDANESARAALDAFELAVGVSVDELAELLDREAAFYIRTASPIPEVTLLLADGEGSLGTLDRLMQQIATSTDSTVRALGDREKELTYDEFAIRYGLFEDTLVVTTAAQGIAVAGEDGDKLADDSEFADAAEGAGMPDETAGFLYVNIEDAVPALLGLSRVAGEPLGADTDANLRPLKSFLAYATSEGSIIRGKGFLRIE